MSVATRIFKCKRSLLPFKVNFLHHMPSHPCECIISIPLGFSAKACCVTIPAADLTIRAHTLENFNRAPTDTISTRWTGVVTYLGTQCHRLYSLPCTHTPGFLGWFFYRQPGQSILRCWPHRHWWLQKRQETGEEIFFFKPEPLIKGSL